MLSQGMYPTIVIVLISMKPSMDYTLHRETSGRGHLFAEGAFKDPDASVQIQFASNASESSHTGTVSEEEWGIGPEAGAIEAQPA